jgi:hypothetical protein
MAKLWRKSGGILAEDLVKTGVCDQVQLGVLDRTKPGLFGTNSRL